MKPQENTVVSIDQRQMAKDRPKEISDQKLSANRENAMRSTGPRTTRGKAFSGRNAMKHGLFTRHLADFAAMGEFQEEYDALLENFHDQYQPVGRAEELEVERITVCWWRLKRSWCYENCTNQVSFNEDHEKRKQRMEGYKTLAAKEQAAVVELQKNIDQFHTTEEVPEDLKQRFLTLFPEYEEEWQLAEDMARDEARARAVLTEVEPRLRDRAFTFITLNMAMAWLSVREPRNQNALETEFGRHLVPKRDTLDKILRYETAIERSLGRALDRLERLQRRRKGEPVPPPVNVHLSQ